MAEQKGSVHKGEASEEFVLTRVVDAPRELVWKAWTERDRLSAWWGPKGFGIQIAQLDLQPGGILLYSMQAPDGRVVWGKLSYREIIAPEYLVFVVSFSDEHGGVTRHWMSDTWPLEILNIVALSDQGGKTTIKLTGGPINATDVERRTFQSAFAGMAEGFKGTFDQLDEYMATQQRRRTT